VPEGHKDLNEAATGLLASQSDNQRKISS
jgi:hypothetical protein